MADASSASLKDFARFLCVVDQAFFLDMVGATVSLRLKEPSKEKALKVPTYLR